MQLTRPIREPLSRAPSSSGRLLRLAKLCERYRFTCGRVALGLDHRTRAVAVAALSFPFLLPVPIPGLSVICGALICLLGVSIAAERRIKLPDAIASRAFPGKLLHRPLCLASGCLRWIEPYLKPRLEFVFDSGVMRLLVGVSIVVGGLVVLLPLPPGTNFLSSLISIIVALGVATRDGLVTLAGLSLFFSKIILYVYASSLILDWLRALSA